MNNSISKAGSWSPRMRLSKRLREQLRNAVASEGADHPPNQSVLSPIGVSLAGVPVKSTKRQLDEIDQSAAKRPRLSTEVEGERAEPVGKTTIIQHPKPKPPHAAFLEKSVEPFEPRFRSDSVDSFVYEWLESVGSDRNTHCRSDSCLNQLASEPVPRQLAKSAPQMQYTRDADGFAVPPKPVSTGSQSREDINSASVALSDVFTSGSSRAPGRSLVEDPAYRARNLVANNIYMRRPRDPMPEHITGLVNHIRQGRNSPEPSPDEVMQDGQLHDLSMGAGESDIETYFFAHIFPHFKTFDSLKRSDRQPLARNVVPNADSNLKVSIPLPDALYGYNDHDAFPQQQAQLISMGTDMLANSWNLAYPFFVIEFKGDGPSGSGSLWVATNQCLGGAASCVNIAERLNHRLGQCKSDKVRLINSAAFSIAMRGTEARLYISWKHDELRYYTANVESFLLQRPNDYLEFRKYVLNIIDWGKGERLNKIRFSLDTLLEESRKRISEAAKARPRPSDNSVAGSKRGKPSSRG
ncbi:hypothetical protein BDY21DRAFT_347885 [Lineolata rhizophorae]|uniref:DUF7924 domain-containing protein n=1 Tax=Lineolata rhizophorae TaxID=578093 RepID=A0A6A6NXA5_9PEZI|nr:hypothetical protein BDY21DRAFT_347885 [Lineolata rhizophorae]